MKRPHKPKHDEVSADTTHRGRVMSVHGHQCLVETESGDRLLCSAKGKKNATVVGDWVDWQPSGHEGRVERVLPRHNLLYRQDELRTKSFAANIDQAVIWLGVEPVFSESQLSRALIACEAAKIPALIVLNKADLPDFEEAWARLQPYRDMGYPTLPMSTQAPTAERLLPTLMAAIQGKSNFILGPSGAGKSSIVNRLIPHAQAATQTISTALNSGKHTTTGSLWYWLDETRTTALIDSPGFQAFGLQHIDPEKLASLMPDLARHLGQCRFYNCTHRHEPGCALQDQAISPNRWRIYEELYEELSRPPNW